MGPSESATRQAENQEAGRRKRLPRRPRMRRCLLKGCEQRFQPRSACQRYCSQGCREAARKWSRWKGQQKYRASAAGKQKRKAQSRRHRELAKSRKLAEPEAVSEPARVITTKPFFRPILRPARLLRGNRAAAAKSLTTLLFGGVPVCAGTRPKAGAAVERSADLAPTY
jgi:hypothetical protein